MRGMGTDLTIGERIAWYRRRRGMSQEVLAGRVGRTVDWLSKIENNRIGLDRLSVIKEVAAVLDVTVGDLLAEPSLMEWPSGTGQRTVPALRDALMSYRQITPLLGDVQIDKRPNLDSLTRGVEEAWEDYQASTTCGSRTGSRCCSRKHRPLATSTAAMSGSVRTGSCPCPSRGPRLLRRRGSGAGAELGRPGHQPVMRPWPCGPLSLGGDVLAGQRGVRGAVWRGALLRSNE